MVLVLPNSIDGRKVKRRDRPLVDLQQFL